MPITVHDWRRLEYLDGAQMRYVVIQGEYPGGVTLAYFDKCAHAKLFAKVLAEQRNTKVRISRDKDR